LRIRLAARAKEEYEPIRWDLMKQRYLKLIEDQGAALGVAALVDRRQP
jgi:hypothetical protein